MAQVKVKLGTTTTRKTVIVDDSKTPKELFMENDIELTGDVSIQLDGDRLGTREMDKSLTELGVHDTAMLLAVVNTKNA